MSTISSSTTSTTAYKVTADTTGTLVLQTGATPTTAMTIDASQNITTVNKFAKESMPIGSVLQVVSTTKTNTFSTASTTFVDLTGLSVSITPTSASNKVMIFVTYSYSSSLTTAIAVFNLLRGSTNISQPATTPSFNGTAINYAATSDAVIPGSINFLDSPATTSAITYKIQCRISSSTLYVNSRGAGDSAFTSTITAMEIAA